MGNSGRHTALTPLSVPWRLGLLAQAFAWGAFIVVGLNVDVGSAGDRTPTPSHASVVDSPAMPPATQPRMAGASATDNAAGSPVSIGIPAIRVTADVASLGLNQDETVEVPENPEEAGWYRMGPKPGESGSAVILGHVDSKVGPAVFYRLKNLDPGDQIAVGLDDGTVAHFTVTRVATYTNDDFPRRKVYASTPDRPALNLVTCGGQYDRAAGGYQSNVVVYTTYLRATDGDLSTS